MRNFVLSARSTIFKDFLTVCIYSLFVIVSSPFIAILGYVNAAAVVGSILSLSPLLELLLFKVSAVVRAGVAGAAAPGFASADDVFVAFTVC